MSAENGTSALSFSPRCRHLCFEAFEVFVAQAEALCRESPSFYIYLMCKVCVRACVCVRVTWIFTMHLERCGGVLDLQNKIARTPPACLAESSRKVPFAQAWVTSASSWKSDWTYLLTFRETGTVSLVVPIGHTCSPLSQHQDSLFYSLEEITLPRKHKNTGSKVAADARPRLGAAKQLT